MADWLKVEKQTPHKPEIVYLARKLGISRGDAFLSWFLLYSWADGITADGSVPLLSGQEIDMVSGAHPGTCSALAENHVDWVRVLDGKVFFQKWDRHNGKSSKSRALDTEKKRRQRVKSCPDDNGTKSGPEKRREDIREESVCVPRDLSLFSSKEKKAFHAPTKAEIDEFCKEKGIAIDADEFIEYYGAQGWKLSNSNAMKDWRLAVQRWFRNRKSGEKKNISALELLQRSKTQ